MAQSTVALGPGVSEEKDYKIPKGINEVLRNGKILYGMSSPPDHVETLAVYNALELETKIKSFRESIEKLQAKARATFDYVEAVEDVRTSVQKEIRRVKRNQRLAPMEIWKRMRDKNQAPKIMTQWDAWMARYRSELKNRDNKLKELGKEIAKIEYEAEHEMVLQMSKDVPDMPTDIVSQSLHRSASNTSLLTITPEDLL